MKKNRTLLQQHRLLREASQLLTIAEKLKTEKPETKHKTSKHAANATSLLTRNVKEFLTSRYDFRYNLLGKSSVSCPLKPSDSAPLKHSTMPP